MATASATIHVDHVTMRFHTDARIVTALEDVSLTVEAGEFVTLLGPSGCGKTTLLRIIAGLRPPSSGYARILSTGGGSDTKVGFVFQDATLLPWRSVQKNVELPLEIAGVAAKKRAAIATEILVMVGLEDFSSAFPSQLSGGMRQRVAIARALAPDPDVLLLDEPFGALDAQTRDLMNLELQRIWMESGKTAVLVTHSISEAAFLGDRVAVLTTNPGRLSDVVRMPFERPRQLALLESEEFLEQVVSLRKELGSTQ